MPPWLLPAATLAADVIGNWWTGREGREGQRDTNRDNIALARETMAFQERMSHSAEAFSERMSSSAVQRAMEDYRRAGLNPALAYERSASSPSGVTAGGAQARVENITASGMQYRQLSENVKATAAAIKNQTRATDAEVKAKAAATKVSEQEALHIAQSMDFNRINQPHTTRALELQNVISQLGITGLENEQELEEKLKALPGGSSKTLLNIIRSMMRPGMINNRTSTINPTTIIRNPR